MNPIEKILKDFSVIILDGALATELEGRGCNINDSLWSAKVLAENPDIIEKVHYDYFDSGADCAITSSYQATIEGFSKRGFSQSEAIDLIQRSVQIAKKARDDFWKAEANKEKRPQPIVAASVGPYGAYLADGSEYRGDYKITEKELIDFHRPRMKALIEAGADILACETIPCLLEAKVIVKLLEEFPGVYCWISFSAKNALEISDGTLISECAKFLDNCEQVAAVGINCTPPQYIPALIEEIKRNSKKPVVVYPNSGEEYDAHDKCWHGHSSSEGYGHSAKVWYEHGASLIGGCCRTSPEDIKAIAGWARK
ncbi:homocysteine S-methyltransferase [Clostridiaceae bacterium UIB06]|nr:homocysteine S-methyltransferase [Clostridiaceae bacterium UIB06]